MKDFYWVGAVPKLYQPKTIASTIAQYSKPTGSFTQGLGFSGILLAGNEGMEKKVETSIMCNMSHCKNS